MLEHDATLVRQPMLVGHQQIEGVWFPCERFNEAQRARLILEGWQTGASAYRFAQGDLLRFRTPVSVQCEDLVGWPLVRQGNALSSALLNPQEMRNLPRADLWWVRGSLVSALQLHDATPIEPGLWVDISRYTLLETYDCSNTLPEPVLEPLAKVSDVREILGDALRPVSPEREGVMQALLERQQNPPKAKPAQGHTPGKHAWQSADGAWPSWLKYSISGLIIAGAVRMASSYKPDAYTPPPAHEATTSVSFNSVMLGMLIVAVLLVMLLMLLPGRRTGASSEGRGAPQTASEPSLAPRAKPATPRPAAWRRWLTRLTLHSRLSALYGKRQAAYMQRMLEMFENGDLEEALRHAIPLGSDQSSGEQAFGTPHRRQDLSISQQRGPVRAMLFEEGLEAQLKKIYRQSFERLDREGRVEEAVFVLAELLKVRQESLDYLEKHKRYPQAAELALAWDMSAAVIVRLLCLADNWQRALQVARRDDAFAAAVMLLQTKWPEQADRLRLEWAEALVAKGQWLQAVDAIWSLPAERERAVQWLLNAQAAGGRLAINALVKRAILLPDTLMAYGEWVEQLRDDPERFTERTALAEALLEHKNHVNALAWLTQATVHSILADQASDRGRLTQNQLQALVKMSKDKLLQADLPTQALKRPAVRSLAGVGTTLQWMAPEMGSRAILDAVPLEGGRYLLALGEVGAAVIDATGKTLFHLPVPAQSIVLAHSRQVALVLARRAEVWRISKLDLVNRTVTDLGVQRLDVFAKSFNGCAWTIGCAEQLRVVDVDRGFETLWHVSDLPGRILGMEDSEKGECLYLDDPAQGQQVWHYQLPDRRLTSREPVPARISVQSYPLFNAAGEVAEFFIKPEPEGDPVLVLAHRGQRKGYRLPGCIEPPEYETPVQVVLLEQWLLIGYIETEQDVRWHFINRHRDHLCATLRWPSHGVQTRCVGADWLLFDSQGRLSHVNTDDGSQHNLSVG